MNTNSAPGLRLRLEENLALYSEVLSLLEAENHCLSQQGTDPVTLGTTGRRELLPRVQRSLERLRTDRESWTRLTNEERRRHPEVASLLRDCQDAIMKVLVLDRANEQAFLRRGMLNPRQLPSYNAHRPQFVSDLYRRQSQPE